MNAHPFFHKPTVGRCLGALLTSLIGLLTLLPGDNLVKRLSYDLPFSFRGELQPQELTIVHRPDSNTPPQSARTSGVWPREEHVRLLKRLREVHARMVIFDLFFDGSEPADAAFALAMQDQLPVVVGSHLHQRRVLPDDEGKDRVTYEIEHPESLFLASALTNGVVEVIRGSDQVVRRLSPHHDVLLSNGTRTNFPTLAWSAASLVAGGPEKDALPPPKLGWWLNYYGRAGTIPSISVEEAMRPENATVLSNRVVLVGEKQGLRFAGCSSDSFASPFIGGSAAFDGVEIHATAFLNLIRNEWLCEPSPWVTLILTIGFGAAIGCGLTRFSPLTACGLAIAVMLLVAVATYHLMFSFRLFLPWLVLAGVQVPVALLWALAYRATKAYIDSQLLQRSLALYVSPKQAAEIIRNPERLRLGGAHQPVSILASDIAGFSLLSERMDAEDLLTLLNRYYDGAINCIHRTDGTVVKLIGDAIFAIWNAPQPQSDHATRACRAALLLQERLALFDQQPGTPPLRTRVGLHSGMACVGNLGSAVHFDFTAIGDSVNLAFRLEGLNKQLGTNILVTRDLLKSSNESFATRPLGYFRFKGLDKVVEVHELRGPGGQAGEPDLWLEPFADGLHQFHRRNFDAANDHFRRVLTLRPNDGPSLFYLGRVSSLRTASLSPEWAGEIELTEK